MQQVLTNRKDLGAGSRGYRKMTRLAAQLVAPGGFLFIASCSHNMTVDLFAEQVRHGLEDARRSGRILRSAGAAPDPRALSKAIFLHHRESDGVTVRRFDTVTTTANQQTLTVPGAATAVPAGTYRAILQVNNQQAMSSPRVVVP